MAIINKFNTPNTLVFVIQQEILQANGYCDGLIVMVPDTQFHLALALCNRVQQACCFFAGQMASLIVKVLCSACRANITILVVHYLTRDQELLILKQAMQQQVHLQLMQVLQHSCWCINYRWWIEYQYIRC